MSEDLKNKHNSLAEEIIAYPEAVAVRSLHGDRFLQARGQEPDPNHAGSNRIYEGMANIEGSLDHVQSGRSPVTQDLKAVIGLGDYCALSVVEANKVSRNEDGSTAIDTVYYVGLINPQANDRANFVGVLTPGEPMKITRQGLAPFAKDRANLRISREHCEIAVTGLDSHGFAGELSVTDLDSLNGTTVYTAGARVDGSSAEKPVTGGNIAWSVETAEVEKQMFMHSGDLPKSIGDIAVNGQQFLFGCIARGASF